MQGTGTEAEKGGDRRRRRSWPLQGTLVLRPPSSRDSVRREHRRGRWEPGPLSSECVRVLVGQEVRSPVDRKNGADGEGGLSRKGTKQSSRRLGK